MEQTKRYTELTKSRLNKRHFVKLHRLLNANQPIWPSVSAETQIAAFSSPLLLILYATYLSLLAVR